MKENDTDKKLGLVIQEAFVNNSKEILSKDNLFEDFNNTLAEFYENPEYGTFKKMENIIKDIDAQIKDTIKNLLVESNLKSSSGPVGKFTLVELSKVNYIEDEAVEKDKRVEKILKLKKQLKELDEDVKNDILLFNKEVKGAAITKTLSVRFYPEDKKVKGKEIVGDYITVEKGPESN